MEDEKILFTIPVTKSWLKQCVLSLLLDCQSSFRGILKMFSSVMDYCISLEALFSYYSDAVALAQVINHSATLEDIETGAHDEMFVNNDPVLTGIEVNSLYCYLASKESQRDADKGAI